MTPRPIAAPSVFARNVGRLVRPLLAALLLCALPLCAAAFRQPERGQAVAEPDPSLQDPLDPSNLTILGWGTSLDRVGGPLSLVNILILGEQRSAWIVQGTRTLSTDDITLGAATLVSGPVMSAGPVASFAFLLAGAEANYWSFLDTDQVGSIAVADLAHVEDLKPVAATPEERSVYWNTVFLAGQTSTAALRSVAQTNWNVSALTKDPASFRGEVFYLEGKLRDIQRFEVPKKFQQKMVAEVFLGEFEAAGKVFSIHFAELPPGVELKKGAEFRASFAGYFFKLVPDKKGNRLPLLIGRTFQQVRPNAGRKPVATAALYLSLQAGLGTATAPLTELALLHAAEHFDYWQLFPAPEVVALQPDLLRQIRDKGFFPGIQDDDIDGGELDAYYDFLKVASRTPVETFARDAQTDVTYAQLIQRPAEFRGQVLRLEGTLKSLRKHKAPKMVQLAGIPFLYEAWIFDGDNGIRPYCVVLTELPAGLEPAAKMTVRVSFDAFFFKKGDYEATDLKDTQRRIAPLFVGRTLKVFPRDKPDTSKGDALLIAGTSFLLVTLVAIFGSALWYRRNDRRMQLRLKAARSSEFVAPQPDSVVPIAAPVTSTKTEIPTGRTQGGSP